MILAVAFALPASGAGAAQQIGMTMYPSNDVPALDCLQVDTATLIQYQRQVGSTPTYTVPAGGGVVTSWAYTAPVVTWPETAALKVFRPVGGTQFRVIGHSAVETIDADGLGPFYNSFLTRIPVQAGDVLGMYVQHLGNNAFCQEAPPTSNTEDKTRRLDATQNPAVGTTLNFDTAALPPNNATEVNARLDLAAMVEPDRDGDGFGDETQDADKGGGSPPVTPVAPKKCKKGQKLKKGKCVKKKRKKK